ncbi:hypothetical protein, partial [Escherichia coli]|uniref:hypothetical protein n=1 Tax=Escherichia coli TaxID=562 RepID=UPI0019642C7A
LNKKLFERLEGQSTLHENQIPAVEAMLSSLSQRADAPLKRLITLSLALIRVLVHPPIHTAYLELQKELEDLEEKGSVLFPLTVAESD